MSNSGFVDFIPEGEKKLPSGDNSAFRDFVPETKLENIPVKKKKPVVVLSEADLAAVKAMEEETIAENGGVETAIPVETPTEPEVGLPPEDGNGEPPLEVTPAIEETPILTEKEQINASEPHVKNRKSGQRKAGRR